MKFLNTFLIIAVCSVCSSTKAAPSDPVKGRGLLLPTSKDFSGRALIRSHRSGFNGEDPQLPDHFDLEEYLPPIGNQGQTASCVGWSTAYYCMSMSVARRQKLSEKARQDPRFLFSPGYIWDQYNEGHDLAGMLIFKAFEVLDKQGCASLAEYPWTERAQPWAPSEAAQTKAARYKATQAAIMARGESYGDKPKAESLKRWLYEMQTPIVFGIPVYSDFPRGPVSEDYVYAPETAENTSDRHAITIIGYSDEKDAFEIVNSWGADWGNHGKLWLSRKFVLDHGYQFCVQLPGGVEARGSLVSPGNRATNFYVSQTP